jgi:FKBP-type peptidyl-prolyl cis-trans isomerase (trigger factor)
MKITGQFEPALREVVVRKITAEKARENGLKITNQKLQKAADAFRMIHGMNRASQTEAWLTGNGITLEALETYLETNLLISAFKDSLVKKTAKTKLYNSKLFKETVREIVYQNWLNKTID